MSLKIGIFGSSTQINHVNFVLRQRYEVIDLNLCMASKYKIFRYINLIIALLKVDVLYNIYNTPNIWRLFFLARLLQIKVITHWIGSDALYFLNKGAVDEYFFKFVNINLSCSENIAEEMKSLGIDSTVIPIVPYEQTFVESTMPLEHAVMIYMPIGREQLYGYDCLTKVFKHFPQLTFFIVANDNKEKFPFVNVKTMGWINKQKMSELYDNISIVIRFVEHDGLSMSIIEGLAKGKIVIWNYDHEFVIKVNSYEEIVNALNEILHGEPKLNLAAKEYVEKKYAPNNFHTIFDNIKNVIDGRQ